MSIWLTLILALIQNLPAIIKAVNGIAEAMKGLPKDEHADVKQELKTAIAASAEEAGSAKPVGDLLERIKKRLTELGQKKEVPQEVK